jgi:hypothetical protein
MPRIVDCAITSSWIDFFDVFRLPEAQNASWAQNVPEWAFSKKSQGLPCEKVSA